MRAFLPGQVVQPHDGPHEQLSPVAPSSGEMTSKTGRAHQSDHES